MDSIEDQIKEDVVVQFYNNIDKNMSIGCGQPFKVELIRLLNEYDISLKQYFELFHNAVLKGKRSALQDLKDEADNLINSAVFDKVAVCKLCEKIKGFNI